MNKKILLAGMAAGAAGLTGMLIAKHKRDSQRLNDLSYMEDVIDRVKCGGNTKPGMERQIYRDLFWFLMNNYEDSLEELEMFQSATCLEEGVEAFASDFAKKVAEYVSSNMIDVNTFSGHKEDGTEIVFKEQENLFMYDACRILCIEDETMPFFPIIRYRELWYTEVGEWFLVDCFEYNVDSKITCREISNYTDDCEMELPIKTLMTELMNFERNCEMNQKIKNPLKEL